MRKLVMAAMLLVATAAVAREPQVAVMVGGNDGLDACMSLGAVTGLNPKGDNFLAVRQGPGTDFDKVDELRTGDTALICDEMDGWFGIVYGEDDCGVSTPIEPRQPYGGPRKSGWVSQTFIEIIAG